MNYKTEIVFSVKKKSYFNIASEITEAYVFLRFKSLHPGWADSSVPHSEKTSCKEEDPRIGIHFINGPFILHSDSQKHKALQPKAAASEVRLVMMPMMIIVPIY